MRRRTGRGVQAAYEQDEVKGGLRAFDTRFSLRASHTNVDARPLLQNPHNWISEFMKMTASVILYIPFVII